MGDNKSLADEKLWLWIIEKDDQQSLSLLFKRYYKELLNYGLHLKPRKQLVKDSIQELFYKIWNKRKRLGEVEYVRSYLYSSLSRVLFRQADIQQKRHERDQAYTDEKTSIRVGNIEQQIISSERKEQEERQLHKAIESLSDSEREAAFLKFYSGLTNDEISIVMNVSKQSVYNYIYRAIGTLKKELGISLSA